MNNVLLAILHGSLQIMLSNRLGSCLFFFRFVNNLHIYMSRATGLLARVEVRRFRKIRFFPVKFKFIRRIVKRGTKRASYNAIFSPV